MEAGDVAGAPIRVLLVDDHPMALDAVARALTDADAGGDVPIFVVGRARSAAEGEAAIRALAPDVVVCDVQMGGEAEGLTLLAKLGRGGRPIFLMLSAFDYPALFRAAFDRGAAGYILKTADLAEVVAAVRTVARGGTAFSAASMRLIRAALRRPSDRELEVLALVAAGHTNDEIAVRLVLSLKTVESHIRRLFNRYGVMNRTELAVLALREGWVDAGLAG